jgi:hypothetical protein
MARFGLDLAELIQPLPKMQLASALPTQSPSLPASSCAVGHRAPLRIVLPADPVGGSCAVGHRAPLRIVLPADPAAIDG